MHGLNKLKAYFFTASRYLLGHSSKGGRYLLGAAAGIALSLIPIMATLLVADGMIQGITDRFLELGTGHLQIRPTQLAYEEGLEASITTPIVESFKGVRGVWDEIQGIGIILGKQGKTGVTIRAISPSFWEDEGSLKYLTTISGEASIKAENDVLLGAGLAQKVGAELGKPLRIMTVRVTPDGRNIPRTLLFTVRGIVSSGYHEIDSMWCIIGFEKGKQLLSGEATEPYLIVKIEDPYKTVDEMAVRISHELEGFFQAYTWKQIQPLQYSSYEQTRQILLFIMAFIVLIAAVNVSSAISMLVIERQRDIAVLKAVGTEHRGITLIFLWGSLITGLSGCIVGTTAGLLLGVHINEILSTLEAFINLWTRLFNVHSIRILDPGFYLETIPIIIHWKTVAGIGVFTVVAALASSWFPARRAGKTKPVDLIRKAP
jgi:lipoprotein-releasing system permease protein